MCMELCCTYDKEVILVGKVTTTVRKEARENTVEDV
jgi:hypothetical protein